MGACVSVETLFKATELCVPSWGADGGGKGPRTELGRGELQVRPAAGQQPRAGGRWRPEPREDVSKKEGVCGREGKGARRRKRGEG